MTFYERERNKQTHGMQEMPVGAQVQLEGSVVRGNRVTRYATVVDQDTLRIDHHLFGFPGIHNGWPVTREYTGEQVNRTRLWKQTPNGYNAPDKRLIWKPTPKR